MKTRIMFLLSEGCGKYRKTTHFGKILLKKLAVTVAALSN